MTFKDENKETSDIDNTVDSSVKGKSSTGGRPVQFTLTDDESYSIFPDEDNKQIVYTIGYEGRTLNEFIDRLKSHGIQKIIDVRERPLSRKAGFSKTALGLRLEEEGIEYAHLRALGAPVDIRHEFKEGGSEKVFFENYRKYILEDVPEEVTVLKENISDKKSALMCFELSYTECHRRVLADILQDSGFVVRHV